MIIKKPKINEAIGLYLHLDSIKKIVKKSSKLSAKRNIDVIISYCGKRIEMTYAEFVGRLV